MVAENRKPMCQECAERTGVLQENTLPMRQCQVCGDYEALYRSSGLVNGDVCWSCACTLVTDCAVEPVAAMDNQPEHVGIDNKEFRSATLS
jgi:ribosomal protein S14